MEVAEEYREAIIKADKVGRELAEMICEIIRPIIPDIDWSLGWAEAGIDTICFWSESRKNPRQWEEGMRFLDAVLSEVFEGIDFDCPFGVWITEEEAEEIKRMLKEVRDE